MRRSPVLKAGLYSGSVVISTTTRWKWLQQPLAAGKEPARRRDPGGVGPLHPRADGHVLVNVVFVSNTRLPLRVDLGVEVRWAGR